MYYSLLTFFNSTGVMNRIVNFISRAKTRKEEKNSFSHNSTSLLDNNLQVLQISRTGINCPKGIVQGVK